MGVKSKIRWVQMKYYGRFGTIQTPGKWLFLVGATNSGTTLLKHVLASHPDIGSLNREGRYYTDQMGNQGKFKRLWALHPEEMHWREDFTSDTEVDVARLKRQWCGKLNDTSRPIFMEKTPAHTLRTLWLQKHFENAHFIGIIRNGYAVAEGIHRKGGNTLDDAAKQWNACNEIMLEDFESLQNGLILRYEDLTEAPSAAYTRICEFLGIEALGAAELEGRVFNFQKTKSTMRNMNYRSLERLTPEQRESIEKLAGALLQRFSYTP